MARTGAQKALQELRQKKLEKTGLDLSSESLKYQTLSSQTCFPANDSYQLPQMH
jgi:hypothetical protein